MPKTSLNEKEWKMLKQIMFSEKMLDQQKINFITKQDWDINAVCETTSRTLLIEICVDLELPPTDNTTKIKIMRLLLENGADPNRMDNKGYTALFLAAHRGLDATSVLVEYKANVNHISQGENITGGRYSPLCAAVISNHIGTVVFLLRNGSDPNLAGNVWPVKSNNLVCALHIACRLKYDQLVELLIKYNADLNMQQTEDKTVPLHMACSSGNLKIAEILLGDPEKINVNAKAVNDIAPIHIAAELGDLAMVKLLVDKGADVNAVTTQNTTAIFKAVEEGYIDITKFLLGNSANPSIMENNEIPEMIGYSPLSVAYQHRHHQVVKLLINYYKVNFNIDEETYEVMQHFLATDKTKMMVSFEHKKKNKTKIEQSSSEQLDITPISSSSQSSPVSSGQSGYAFLSELGLPADVIKEMEKENKQRGKEIKKEMKKKFSLSTISVNDESDEVVTWLNGRLRADMPNINSIDSSSDFSYLDAKALEAQGCPNVASFQKIRIKFCGEEGQQGLKDIQKISGKNYSISIMMDGEEKEVLLVKELKKKGRGGKWRVMFFRIPQDKITNETSPTEVSHDLWVGCFFGELHNNSDSKKLQAQSKRITIHLPPSHKEYITGIRELFYGIGFLGENRQDESAEGNEAFIGNTILEYANLRKPSL